MLWNKSYTLKFCLYIIICYYGNAMAFNTESSINYNFSKSLLTSQNNNQKNKKQIASLPKKVTAKLQAKPAKSASSATLAAISPPLKLETDKKKFPVKVIPKFDNASSVDEMNSQYLYNGLLNSNIYFNYKSTLFNINQNSINITYTYK